VLRVQSSFRMAVSLVAETVNAGAAL